MGVVPILLMRKKNIIRKLKSNGAISKETAKTLKEAGVFNPDAFPKIIERLVKDRILIKTNDNKYYLNKWKWEFYEKYKINYL